MDFCFNIIQLVNTALFSTFDVLSDFLLSLDFIGLSLKLKIAKEAFNITMNEPEIHPTWGYITMGIMFLPGLIIWPILIYMSIVVRNKKYALIGLFLIPLFPFAMIVFQISQIVSFCKHRVQYKEVTSLAMILTGTEAFWESVTQMVFQGYTILNGLYSDSQMISITASFLTLSYTSILFDVAMTTKDLTASETFFHILSTIPCYLSTIVYRVMSLSISIAFLRPFSIIPISFLIIELSILSYDRYKNLPLHVKGGKFIPIYISTLTNLGVLNSINMNEYFNANEDGRMTPECIEACKKFIKRSSILTLVHHSVILLVIISISENHPDFFKRGEQYRLLELEPASMEFYSIFGLTFMFGIFSTTLSLNQASKIINVNSPDPTYGLQEEF